MKLDFIAPPLWRPGSYDKGNDPLIRNLDSPIDKGDE